MTKSRPVTVTYILQAFLTINLLLTAISCFVVFIAGDACGVYVSGIFACCSLLETIGFLQLLRWQKIGLWVILTECLLLGLLLPLLFPEWLSYHCGKVGTFLPLILAGGTAVVALAVTFIPFGGHNLWSRMDSGFDVAHFRHIYQLSAVVILAVGAGMFFIPWGKELEYQNIPVKPAPLPDEKDEKEKIPARPLGYNLLDSADVTLDEVIAIETMIDTLPAETQVRYAERIFALKHILLSELTVWKHDADNLMNICKVHEEEFSPQQAQIIYWYMHLPKEERLLWEKCSPASHLLDFRTKLSDSINNSNNIKNDKQ